MGYKPIGHLLRQMAIPAIIANIVSALYNIVDQIFIGHGVGYLGNAATSIAFMLVISGIILSGVIIVFLKDLMVAFGATDQILSYAMEYTGITSFGIPFLLFSIGTNPLVRADGASTYSMTAIILGAVLNTILDPIFIFGFDLGIAGAAWATVISQIASAIMLGVYFTRFKSVDLKKDDFIPSFKLIKLICVMGITSLIFQASNMVVQVSINNLLKFYGATSIFGSEIPIAVSGIVMKVNVIFIAIAIGLVQGAQPICGYNYGARKYKRVRQTVTLLLKTTFAISVIVFAIFEIFPREIISIFGTGDDLYFQFGTKFMRIFLFFTFFNGIQISITTFFPSIGKPIKGAILSLVKQVVFLLPLLFILPRFLGVDGVMYAMPISDTIAFTFAVIFLYREFKMMPKEDFEYRKDEIVCVSDKI